LLDFGFRSIIAPSFADIFYNNCFKNGILPNKLDQSDVDHLMKEAEHKKNLTINLEEESIIDKSGKSINFIIEAFRKKCLIEGLDDIDLTLKKSEKINIYEEKITEKFSWIL